MGEGRKGCKRAKIGTPRIRKELIEEATRGCQGARDEVNAAKKQVAKRTLFQWERVLNLCSWTTLERLKWEDWKET